MITPIPDSFVIARKAGVYKHSNLAERDGHLYIGFGSGWAKMYADGSTSVPGLKWTDARVVQGSLEKHQHLMVWKQQSTLVAAE